MERMTRQKRKNPIIVLLVCLGILLLILIFVSPYSGTKLLFFPLGLLVLDVFAIYLNLLILLYKRIGLAKYRLRSSCIAFLLSMLLLLRLTHAIPLFLFILTSLLVFLLSLNIPKNKVAQD